MRFASIFALIFLTACSNQTISKLENEDIEATIKKYNTELMEGEAQLLESFFTREEFHVEMLWECTDKEVEPYEELIFKFDSLRLVKDNIQTSRGEFYVYADSLDKASVNKSKSIKTESLQKIQHDASSRFNYLDHQKVQFFNLENQYQDICDEYGIIRITHGEYADSLLRRMVIWEDSLVEQGRTIGKLLGVLVNSGYKKGSPEYMNRYRFVSEMQLMHKTFQSYLVSISNQHGRYNSARQDDFFYRGPAMAPRADVDFSESEFDKLKMSMQAFRDTEQEFYLVE